MAENKRFYWLKLKRDFFKRHDIRIIEEMPNGKDYILFYLKLLLESIDHEGALRFSDTIPYNEQMLSVITNTNIDLVRSAMKIFTELHMIDVLEDSTIYMLETEKMLGSESASAGKMRALRERQKKSQCDLPVIKSDTEKELEREEELKRKKEKKKTAASPFDGILSKIENEELREAYRNFIKMRDKIKAPMTEYALELLIKKVNRLEKSVDGQIQLIEDAVLNCWKSVYPKKDEPKKVQNPRNPRTKTQADPFMNDLMDMYDNIIDSETNE